MVTLADSLVSSSARKMPIRKRPDLSARRQYYQGRSYWVVKDPVGLNYFRFQDEEYAILNMLDGETSLDEIKERFEAEFPPQKITLEELQHFLGMLHRSGLIISAVPGQGHELHNRRKERKKKELVGALTNILCIRFKGFDPERVLNWLQPKLAWFFSTPAQICCIILALAALSLVLVEFDVFRSKLPQFSQFFSPTNAMWLMVVLGATKVLHEFGHGLTCKHFGGECHEMGVMILVLTPCLYCNVSDSWMLPSKWKRAAIGAAGMYVEVVLASICTFVWWFTEPGLLNNLALNVMFISSVSTVLFNANPLLRYDGYYILADLAEIPNLRQKATSILQRKSAETFLGLEQPEDPFLPQKNQIFFALYSIAAFFYRWLVVFSILWFLYHVFKPYGLQVLGQVAVAVSLYGMFIHPLYRLVKYFKVPGRLDKVKKPRMFATLAGIAAVVAAVLFVPLPHRVMANLEIEPRNEASVYVSVPGELRQIAVRPGQRVRAGDKLASLRNDDLDQRIIGLEGERNLVAIRLDHLRLAQFDDPKASSSVPTLEEELRFKKAALDKEIVRRRLLSLTAPRDGVVIPPPAKPKKGDPEMELPTWGDTPLESRNVGAFLEDGTLFCQVADPSELEAVLVIDQGQLEYVLQDQQEAEARAQKRLNALLEATGIQPVRLSDLRKEGEADRNRLAQLRAEIARVATEAQQKEFEEIVCAGVPVDIKLDLYPHDIFHGTIREIAMAEVKVTSQRMSTKAGGDVPTTTDPESGAERPMRSSYQARVPIDDPHGRLRVGLGGQAKIHTRWIPLGTRLWRLLSETFRVM